MHSSRAPRLGALGATFTAMRAMEFISLIAVIGLTANFVNDIVNAGQSPPEYLTGTLVVVSSLMSISCIAAVYVCVTYLLYYDAMLPFVYAAAADGAILIALAVVSVVIGRPVSFLSCEAIMASNTGSAASFFASLAWILPGQEGLWAAGDRGSCFQVKAVWGLAIALCVMFAFSTMVTACLWRRLRTIAVMEARVDRKDVERC
jgi:hypothetical protein